MRFCERGGLKLPVIGLGTWEMGGRYRAEKQDDDVVVDALFKAVQCGVTHFDTAAMYGAGHTEILLGEALKNVERSRIQVTTKVWHTELGYDNLISSAYASLERLKMNYIDLFLIHAPNHNVPLQQTMQAMSRLVDEKVVKHIGVSNFGVKDLQQAMLYTHYPLACNQVEYSLLIRNQGVFQHYVERDVIPFCQVNNLMVMAWRPLMKGDVTKLSGMPLVRQLCQKYHCTPVQLALNWLVAHDGVVAIPKSINVSHIKENMEAVRWEMMPGDIRKLDLLV